MSYKVMGDFNDYVVNKALNHGYDKTWKNDILDKTIVQRFNDDYRGYHVQTLRQLEPKVLDDYKEFCHDIEKTDFIKSKNNLSFKEFLDKFYKLDRFTLIDLFMMNELKLIYLPDWENILKECQTNKEVLHVLIALAKQAVTEFVESQDRLVVYNSVMIEDFVYHDTTPLEVDQLYQSYFHLQHLLKNIGFNKKYFYVDHAYYNYLLKDNLIVRTSDLMGAISDKMPESEKECKELFNKSKNKDYIYNMVYKDLKRKI